MATTPQTPVPSTPQSQYDELSGVYGWFRRHQKKLLYTAGLFTLLTFSITSQMTSVVGEIFGRGAGPMPTIAVNGKREALQVEDYTIAREISRNFMGLPSVLPGLHAGDGGDNDLVDVLAILRRAAIAEGIEVSMADVEQAIDATVKKANAADAQQMARARSFPSLAQYRLLTAEAMRIGVYVRLQTLALDTTDASVLKRALADKEKITLRVATFDEKALEDQLKTAGVSDEDLRKWLEGKNEVEKQRMQAYDLPRAKLRFGALMLAEGQFDPTEWQADVLKDFVVGEDQLKAEYQRERDARFKIEGKDEYKPLEDAAVKAELTRLVQAEHVMNHLMVKIQERLNEQLKPLSDERVRLQADLATSEASVNELGDTDRGKVGMKKAEIAAKKKELEAKPDDTAIKDAIAALEKELETLENDLRQATEVRDAKKLAFDAADKAWKDAAAAFDFPAAFRDLTKDKKGFVTKEINELKNADELKDLDKLKDVDANELGLGQWSNAAMGTRFQNKGDLGRVPGRTTKAVLLYQATDVQPRPEKPWDKLKPLAEGAYWTEKAKAEGETKRKAMEEALLRLAKAKMPEKLAEIEGKRASRVDEKLAAWEKTTQEGIAEAERLLARPNIGGQARAAWQRKLDTLKATLAKKEQVRKDFDAEIGKAIEAEVAEEAKKFHGEVLEAAAAEAGFTVTTVGPYMRELSQRPRFDKAYDPTVVFLFRSHSDIERDKTTGLVTDATNRRYHVAVCTNVEPLAPADVTRRDFEAYRGAGRFNFADYQAVMAYAQAFTVKALEARYDLQRPAGEQVVPGKDGANDKKPDDGKKADDKKPDDKKPDDKKPDDKKPDDKGQGQPGGGEKNGEKK